MHELLDLVEHRLASLGIELVGLLAEEAVEVGVAAVGTDAAGDHEGLDAGGRAAGRRAALPHELLEGFLGVPFVEGRALERA